MTDSLKKRYAIKLFANMVSGLINVLLVAIVPKALGPVVFGHFIYVQQFFNQTIAFLDLGSSIGFFTKLSARNERKELIKFYHLFSLALLCILCIFIFLAEILGYTDLLLTGIPIEYVYLGLFFGFLTWFTQVYIKISDAYAITVSVELLKIVHKILMLGILLYIINDTSFDLSIYYYFHFLSLLTFILILNVLFSKKNIVTASVFFIKVDYKKIIAEFYKFCSPLFLFNVIAIAIALFDVWLLQKVSGSVETGFYGLAYSIAAMCFLFTSAMTPIVTREFSKLFVENNIKEMSILFKRYVPMLYVIAVYFSVFIAFEAGSLLDIFTDERFKGAYFTLVIMAFYPIHQTYGQINAALFFATDDTVRYRNVGLISSFFGLVLSYILIYKLELGAEGFAWKMIISQLVAVNLQLYFNTRKLKLSYLYFLFHQIYSLLFFCIIAYISTSLINIEGNVELDFILTGLLYSFVTVCSMFIFPSLFGMNKNKLLKKIRSIRNKF